MDFSQFHFAHAAWLWGLLAIPLVMAGWCWTRRAGASSRRLEQFADKTLLPHLIRNRPSHMRSMWLPCALWVVAWTLGMMAMAGPQWRYTDTQIYKPENDLVILLDLSSSMNADDIKPSRLDRAREKIADLLEMNRGITIGLVAYADVPHMVVPLTDDMTTILRLLPSLDTSLITLDGDRLEPAISMAASMLNAEPGHDKSILVISDGNFRESDMEHLVGAADGARIFTMGVGTQEGAPARDQSGSLIKDISGRVAINHLYANKLQALATTGHGIYVEAGYGRTAAETILEGLGNARDEQKVAGKTIRVWDEGFYIPLLAAALLLLPWFRKGRSFPLLLLYLGMMLPASAAHAEGVTDWFLNSDQQGAAAYRQGQYGQAMEKFSDPYRQGVAAYKAGQYAKAADLFQQAESANQGTAAEYNLGNAQLMQSQPEAAIKSYESVLAQTPDDAAAKHNLEIAKKLLQQQKEQQQQKLQQQSDKKQNSGKESDQAKQAQQKSQESKSGGSQSAQQQQSGKDQKTGQTSGQQSSQAESKPQQGQAGTGQKEKQPQQQAEQQPGSQQEQQQTQGMGKNGEQQGQSSALSQQSQLGQQQADRKNHAEEQAAQQNQQATTQPLTGQKPALDTAGQMDKEGAQPPSAYVADSRPRTQRDIDADQWLDHIQSDPGSFLKNQFMIEEKQNADRQEGSDD